MKHNKLLTVVSIILIFSLVTSCSNIQNNSQYLYDKSTENSDYIPKEYASLNEIRNQLQDDILNNKTKIELGAARVGTGEIMPSYEFKMGGIELTTKDDNVALNNIVKYVFNNSPDSDKITFISKYDPIIEGYPANDRPIDLNNDGLIERVNAYLIDILKYVPDSNTPSKGIYIHSTGDSFGSLNGFDNNDYYWYMNYPTIDTYDVFYTDIDDSISYTMVDGNKWSINDAVQFFEDFYNNYLSLIDVEPLTYLVESIYVKQLDTDKYGYLAKIIVKDKNGNFFDYDSYKIGLEPQSIINIATGEPFVFPEKSLVYAWNKEEIGQYVKKSSINFIRQTSQNDKLLTLYSALNTLSSSFKNQSISVQSVELNYVQVCKGYPYFKKWNWDYETQGNVFYESLCQDSCEFELRPMWVFQFDLSIENSAQKILVDAVDGKVWSY